MTDLRTKIILDLIGNLPAQGQRFGRALENMGARGARAIGRMNRVAGTMGRGLDRIGNRYATLISGVAGAGTLRMMGDLETRFTRLGIQANKSADDMERLKRLIFETAQAPDIRVVPSQITSAIEEIVEKTGDLDFATANIHNLAASIQATGAAGRSIGGIAAEFQKMGITDPAKVREALDILAVQGKAGAFTLQNLAALGPRVVTAYTAMGRTGVPAIREMGAALQVIMQGAGSADNAATIFEALLRTLGDAEKLKILQRGGIQVFEPGSVTVMRSLPDIMEEIVRKTGGAKPLLSKVFDENAAKAFNAMATEFQRTGAFQSLEKFYGVQADGRTVMRDSARAARDFNAILRSMATGAQDFADARLAPRLEAVAGAMSKLDRDTQQTLMEAGLWGGAALGGAILGRKVYQGGRSFMGMFRKGGAGKGGPSVPGMGGMTGVVPVYVVNRHMSLLNDGSGFNPGAGSPGPKPGGAPAAAGGRWRNWARAAGYLSAIGATVATFDVATSMARSQVDRRLSGQDMDTMAGIMNKWAKLGSTHMYEYRQAEKSLREAEMRGELKITIDQQGFAKVTRLEGQNLDLDVDTGRTMRMP